MSAPADDIFELAPDDVMPLAAPEYPPEVELSCPACCASMGEKSLVCARCGYDKRVGLESSRAARLGPRGKDGAPHCSKCGYALVGLREPRCPECGAALIRLSVKERAAEESRKTARRAVITTAAALVLAPAVTLSLAGLAGGWPLAAGYAVFSVIAAVAGMVVYVIGAAVDFGFTMRLDLALARIAAIMIVANSAFLMPLGMIFPSIIWGAIIVGLYMRLLEGEAYEGAIVALGSFLFVLISMMWLAR